MSETGDRIKYPFAISIPHCATRLPADIRAQIALSDREITDSKDFGSEEIFESLPAEKIVKAKWSRLAADLNRTPDNRGPKGIVTETDYKGRKVYLPGRYPDAGELEERIRKYYAPYHEALSAAVKEPGIKALFDCHSLNGTGPADAPDAGKKRKDIIISNYGKKDGSPDPELGEPTCPEPTMQIIRSAFEDEGFSVSVNHPYRGGYIMVHYGRILMECGGFAVQIEMNQDLYMPEGSFDPDPEKLEDVRKRVATAFKTIAGV